MRSDWSSEIVEEELTYRVGGGVAPAVLPHHRTYGSVYGGSQRVLKTKAFLEQ